jgi:Protein of unknown function (DUF4232)
MFNFRSASRTMKTLAVASMVVASSLLLVTGSPDASATGAAPPSCQGSNLAGTLVRTAVATGHVVSTIAITNVGPRTCLLGGFPTLVGLRGSARFDLHVTGHDSYDGNLHPTDLAPRMSGALIVSTGDLCGPTYGVIPPSQTYSGMIVVLPKDEGTVQVPAVTFDTTCGLVVSQLGWRSHFSLEQK